MTKDDLGEQLLKLVVEWRMRADNSAGNIPVATEKCADELEELIERHKQQSERETAVSLCKGQCGVYTGWIKQCPECGAGVRLMNVKDPELVLNE